VSPNRTSARRGGGAVERTVLWRVRTFNNYDHGYIKSYCWGLLEGIIGAREIKIGGVVGNLLNLIVRKLLIGPDQY
jgi:hypothetical protein